MVYCPECGERNPDGSQFCGVCGSKLPSSKMLVKAEPRKKSKKIISGMEHRESEKAVVNGKNIKILLGVGIVVIVAIIAAVLLLLGSSALMGGTSAKDPADVVLELNDLPPGSFVSGVDNWVSIDEYANLLSQEYGVSPQQFYSQLQAFGYETAYFRVFTLPSNNYLYPQVFRFSSSDGAKGFYEYRLQGLSPSMTVSGPEIGDETTWILYESGSGCGFKTRNFAIFLSSNTQRLDELARYAEIMADRI